jgi:hypothetical protein
MDATAKKTSTRRALGLLIALNLLTLTALWLVVIRQPRTGGPLRTGQDGGPDEVQAFLRRELGLSDRQAKAFEDIRDKFVAAALPSHDEMRMIKEQVLAEMFKPAPDRSAIEAMTARIGVLRGEEERLLSLHFLDMMVACTPEQKPKFRSILREFMIRIGALEPSGPAPRPGDRPRPGLR